MRTTSRQFDFAERPFGSALLVLRWLFDSSSGSCLRFIPRWIFLRALAGIYFSAFYSLLFQIEGLIGPRGILPAQRYLNAVRLELGLQRFWFAPTLFWLSSGSHAMLIVVWIGLLASIAAFVNAWPRLSFLICLLCFMSFVTAAQDFSSYQSDGMLLEAGFIALFFAPRGLWPGLGLNSPVSRAALFLLQWEWFRIYFESGLVKLLSGDPEWRHFTAMDEYYQNGPLPTWIGWYIQHLPHSFHAFTAGATLAMELVIVWMLFLPRTLRFICFCIVTVWEIPVILTANYTFLNYLVLSLGFLLLDDHSIRWLVPARFRQRLPAEAEAPTVIVSDQENPNGQTAPDSSLSIVHCEAEDASAAHQDPALPSLAPRPTMLSRVSLAHHAVRTSVAAFFLLWIAYATTAEMVRLLWSDLPLWSAPVTALEPLRIANQYGLFAVMTPHRYEIEFQGSNDGSNWISYPFRYKPQTLNAAPGIYAPYQPRFEWNLWFASLGDWRQYNFVPLTEERLLDNDPDVLSLFRSNPFPQSPPRYIRAVISQYWFTAIDEKRSTGNWWRKELLGLYAPELTRTSDGKFDVIEWPEQGAQSE